TIPPRAPEAGVVIVASPAGVLYLITYSSTISDSSEHPPTPSISPFMHSSEDSAVNGSLERPPS
ncbi:hypothetical protein Tco_0292431, partial [Tanacetum coccineum]